MNIIEAIKSGMEIRRRGRTTWATTSQISTTHYLCDYSADQWIDPDFYLKTIGVDREDLLADDWEIRETEVPITRTKFFASCRKVMIEMGKRKHIQYIGPDGKNWFPPEHLLQDSFGDLARELGLGEGER